VHISGSAFGDFVIGTFCPNDPPYQPALPRLKTVQAWRKSLNEFKAARLTCLGCGGCHARRKSPVGMVPMGGRNFAKLPVSIPSSGKSSSLV